MVNNWKQTLLNLLRVKSRPQEKLLKNGKAYGFTADDYADIQAIRDYWTSSFEK